MPASAPNVYVTPSGEGIAWVATDGAISNLVNNSATQTLAILDAPANYSSTLPFTLTFNGQTTATITAGAVPPATYFQWNRTGLTPGTYDLAVNPFVGGTGSPNVWYEVFDGATYLGKTVLNVARDDGAFYGGPADPPKFLDPVLLRGNGTPVEWFPLGRFTFATSSLSVRVSCPPNQQADGSTRDFLTANDLRVATTDGATVTRVQATSPPATIVGNFQGGVAAAEVVGDAPMVGAVGTGAGPRFVLDPADVLAKFRALSTVGTGNVAVTGTGTPADPIRIAFAGALADAAQPPVTCSLDSSHVAIATAAAGGILPGIKINGTPVAIPHADFVWSSVSKVWPVVHAVFPQCPPADSVIGPGYYDAQLPGLGLVGTWGRLGDGYQGAAQYCVGIGPTSTYYLRPATAGTYRVSLTWTPRGDWTTDAVLTVRSFASGATLATYHFDQTAAPSGATAHGLAWQVGGSVTLTATHGDGLVMTLSNATGSVMISDALRVERTSPDTSVKIGPGDVVTYSAGAGWYTSAGGAAPAATDAPVDNRSGGTLYTPSTAPTTMKIGYNLGNPNQASSLYYYTDLSRLSYALMGRDGEGKVFTAFPTLLGASSQLYGMTACNQDFNAHRMAGLNVRTGRYDLWWKGASDAGLSAGTAGTWSEVAGQATFPATSGQWNRRVYDLGGDAYNWSPFVDLIIHGTSPVGDGTWNADFTALHILPHGMDPDNFPKYTPAFSETFIGQVGRSMDLMAGVDGSLATIDDYDPPQSILGKGTPYRLLNVGIGRVEAYTGTEFNFPKTKGIAFKMTAGTAASPAPHGLYPFQKILALGMPTVTVSDGTTSQTYDFDGSYSLVWVVSPTEFVYFSGPGHVPGWQMVGVATDPGGVVQLSVGGGSSVTDIREIWRAQDLDLHFNTGFGTLPETLTELGRRLGHPTTGLAPGRQLYHEVADESWNFGFPTFNLASKASYIFYGADPDDETAYTCERSVHDWPLLKAGWVEAGRSPSDFVRVLGTNNDNAGTTQRRVAYMAARRAASVAADGTDGGYSFDALCGAPYFSCIPNGAAEDQSFAQVIDLMTVEQHLDFWETTWTWGGYQYTPPGHLSILAANGYPDVKYIGYEGGPGLPLMMGGSFFGAVRLNNGPKGHGVWAHPRMHGILLNNFKILQDAGLSQLTLYQYSGADTADVNGWPAHTSTGQLDYVPGDAAQDDIQVNRFDQLDLIRSITGGAVKSFAARYNATATPDFSLAASGTSGLVRGSTTTRTVTLTATGGFTGTAVLSASGLPTGVTASFSPTSLTGGGTMVSTLTLTAGGSATLGPATVTITGTDSADSLSHTATSSVTVTSATAPDYTLAVSGSGTLTRGSTATRTVTLTATNGYTGTATLSASGLPTGVTVSSFSPATVTGGGTMLSTLTLAASGSASLGTVTITVTATDAGNSLVHAGTSSLTVVAPSAGGPAVMIRRVQGFRHIRA